MIEIHEHYLRDISLEDEIARKYNVSVIENKGFNHSSLGTEKKD